MPKDLATRKQCCIEWMSCPSPTAFPCQSDDESDVGIGESEQDAMHALLGMAASQLSSHFDREDCMMIARGGIFRFVLPEYYIKNIILDNMLH